MELNELQRATASLVNSGASLVVVAPTSSGKTVVAEQYLRHAIEGGRKGLYLSPLKALTDEKLHVWEEAGYDCVAFTSDHERPGLQVPQDLVLMTNEMFDSKSRAVKSFLRAVGTVVADEAHLIGAEGRGPALEVGLMRMLRANPHVRVVLLSATVSNPEDLVAWLRLMGIEHVELVQTSWRPVSQTVTFHRAPVRTISFLNATVQIINSHRRGQTLVFVHSVRMGKVLATRLKCPFHHSRLSREDRVKLEESFRRGEIGLMVSTSTLAYGVNLPADCGFIVGGHRGLALVDPSDLVQMAGRIGRLGLKSHGYVHFIFRDDYYDMMKAMVENLPPVRSKLPDKLYFHLCSFVAREGMGRAQVREFLERSFMSVHRNVDDCLRHAEDKLASNGILDMKVYKCNVVGRASALMYVDPLDLKAWCRNFAGKPMTPKQVAQAIADVPSYHYDMAYDSVPAVKLQWSAASACASAIYRWLSGSMPTDEVERMLLAELRRDFGRIANALAMCGVDRTYIYNVQKMVESGVEWRYLDLVRLPGIGRSRAKALWDAGVRTQQDVLNKLDIVSNIVGKKLSGMLVAYLNKEIILNY